MLLSSFDPVSSRAFRRFLPILHETFTLCPHTGGYSDPERFLKFPKGVFRHEKTAFVSLFLVLAMLFAVSAGAESAVDTIRSTGTTRSFADIK